MFQKKGKQIIILYVQLRLVITKKYECSANVFNVLERSLFEIFHFVFFLFIFFLNFLFKIFLIQNWIQFQTK